MQVQQILETCLYVDDLEAAREFYSQVLGLTLVTEMEGRHVFFRCGQTMLLLFNPDSTSNLESAEEAPAHGARGRGHCCFTMDEGDTDSWRERLNRFGVDVEKETQWPQGGVSLYFRDPSENCLELATRRVWGIFD